MVILIAQLPSRPSARQMRNIGSPIGDAIRTHSIIGINTLPRTPGKGDSNQDDEY